MVLVGVTKVKSKKTGNEFCLLHLLGDEGRDPHTEGRRVQTEFIEASASPVGLIGSEVVLEYEKGYNGRAVCVDVREA